MNPDVAGTRSDVTGVLAVALGAREGGRNSALHWSACRLWERVRDGLLGDAQVESLLLGAAGRASDSATTKRGRRSARRAGGCSVVERSAAREAAAILAAANGVPTGPAVDTVDDDIAALYEPLDWAELWQTAKAEPDWLVPQVIERGRSYSLVARSKVGKSLISLDMVAALATGRALLGRPNPHPGPVRVMYLDLENAPGDLKERLQDLGYTPETLGTNLRYYSFPALPPLDAPQGARHLAALVDRDRPDLIVIDTLSRVVKGNENDAETIQNFYRYCLVGIKARGIAVLRLDHLGKYAEAGSRGTSAKTDDVDAELCLVERDGDYQLRCTYQRNGHHPDVLYLVKQRRNDAHPLRHLIVAAPEPVAEERENPVETLVAAMEELKVPTGEGRDKVGVRLRKHGVKVRNEHLSEAIKVYREKYGPVGLIDATTKLSPRSGQVSDD